jgi:pimeloyl-ACP methyl ester carboxylesterase
MLPQTHYAKSGDVSIAYQVFGSGPRDLVYVPGWASNIDLFWEEPTYARMLNGLASFSRVFVFDKRGTGLSGRVSDMPSLEVRMDDVRAVMVGKPPLPRSALATSSQCGGRLVLVAGYFGRVGRGLGLGALGPFCCAISTNFSRLGTTLELMRDFALLPRAASQIEQEFSSGEFRIRLRS